MKIIHSFWSKPTLERGTNRIEDRKIGGWLDKKYNYMSWALSCLQFKKHYGHIELITDCLGKKTLIDKLELPYNKVLVELDAFNDNHPDLWAVTKLHAYSLQTEPFIHVDGDVYVWKRLENIENKSLVVQNEDIGFKYYDNIWNIVKENFQYIPQYMLDDFANSQVVKSCNAGVFGGTDIDFIQEYVRDSLDFLQKNQDNHSKVNLNLAGLIYEQYLFSCFARSRKKNVSYLFHSMSDTFKEICNFSSIPQKRHYVHTVGRAKKKLDVCENVANQLLLEYPEYYYYILELLEKSEL